MKNFEIYTYLKAKKGGGEPAPAPVTNPALRLMDWEGTVLKEYTAEQVASLTALPTPSSLNTNVDRELLSFQGYNWALSGIKSWVTAHEGQCLTVGAIYTTTDGQDHNYWDNPRFDTADMISMQKRSTTSIENDAFKQYRLLKNINIPDGVTSIGTTAFMNCYTLKNINIPDGVTSIGTTAFMNCYTLKNINIPDGVTSIGNSVFQGCTALENINIPDSVTSIERGAFYTCTALKNINIPDGVTSIGDLAFQGCTALENINVPDGVTSIGNSVFQGCTALENINIPDGVTNIGNSAFQSCYVLENINIPASVTSIGNNAFNNSRVLADVVIQGKPSLTNVNAFDNTYDGLRIYVPREYLSWYSTATNWDVFYDDEVIVAIEDHIEYLESIGIDVSDYEEEQT